MARANSGNRGEGKRNYIFPPLRIWKCDRWEEGGGALGRGDLYKSRHKQAGALLLHTQNFVEARMGGGGRRGGAIIQARLRCLKNGGKGRDGGVTNFSTKALACLA